MSEPKVTAATGCAILLVVLAIRAAIIVGGIGLVVWSLRQFGVIS